MAVRPRAPVPVKSLFTAAVHGRLRTHGRSSHRSMHRRLRRFAHSVPPCECALQIPESLLLVLLTGGVHAAALRGKRSRRRPTERPVQYPSTAVYSAFLTRRLRSQRRRRWGGVVGTIEGTMPEVNGDRCSLTQPVTSERWALTLWCTRVSRATPTAWPTDNRTTCQHQHVHDPPGISSGVGCGVWGVGCGVWGKWHPTPHTRPARAGRSHHPRLAI